MNQATSQCSSQARTTIETRLPASRWILRGQCAGLVALLTSHASPCRAQSLPEEDEAATHVEPASTGSRPVPTATYWLGGAAVGSFVTAGALLAYALDQRAEARRTCAPACPSERRQIQRTLLTADVVGISGGVLAVLAVYSFLTRPTLAPATARPEAARAPEWLTVRSVSSGAIGELTWKF